MLPLIGLLLCRSRNELKSNSNTFEISISQKSRGSKIALWCFNNTTQKVFDYLYSLNIIDKTFLKFVYVYVNISTLILFKSVSKVHYRYIILSFVKSKHLYSKKNLAVCQYISLLPFSANHFKPCYILWAKESLANSSLLCVIHRNSCPITPLLIIKNNLYSISDSVYSFTRTHI